MNKIRSFFALYAVIAAISLVSVTAQANTAAKPVKTIERQITHQIRMLPYYGVFDNITFQVNGGTVTLSGKVISLGTRRDAEASVKLIAGVTRVINNIENLPPSSFDDAIRRATLRTFIQHGPSQYFWEVNPDVRIIVDGGRVTLEGYVYSSGDANRLNILANTVPGVFHVQNNLIVGEKVYR